MEGSEKLYNYVLHFNHNTGLWSAIPRGKEADYFANMSGSIDGIIKNKNPMVVIAQVNSLTTIKTK